MVFLSTHSERQPKNVIDIELAIIAEKMNNRPRKTLGFATPNEIFTSK